MWVLGVRPFKTAGLNNTSDHRDQRAQTKTLPCRAFSQASSSCEQTTGMRWEKESTADRQNNKTVLRSESAAERRPACSLLAVVFLANRPEKVSSRHFELAQFYALTLGCLRAAVKKRRSGLLSIKRRGPNNFLRALQTPSALLAHASPTRKSALGLRTWFESGEKHRLPCVN